MKRTRKHKNADLILVSDVHLRLSVPEARKDDFLNAQWHKLDFISELQQKHGCPILNGGDLFHHWKPSPELISLAITHMPEEFYTIYGQHDLPDHNMDLKHKSGIYALEKAGALTVLPHGHWNEKPKEPVMEIKGRKIFVWHKFVYRKKEFWQAEMGKPAGGILRKYPQFDLILTGDNHQAFVEEHEGRLLVNPGSMMRTTAAQIEFEPRVYLYYAATNTVKPVYLPIEKDVLSREHIDKVTKRDERISAFVQSLDTTWEGSVSFENNLKTFFETNKVKQNVEQIVYKAID